MASSSQCRGYRFGSFTLDLEWGALIAADGREVPLRPKSFALLQLLVENVGRLMSQEVIMEALWPTVFVTENNVTQCIHDIRRALGVEARETLRTRPRRGYLFTSDITMLPAAASSVGDDEGEEPHGPTSAVAANGQEHEPLVAEDEEGGQQAYSASRSGFRTAAGVIFHHRSPVVGQDRPATIDYILGDTTENFFADLQTI
jgi:DNA-binding winged helix-turn-helix (wHTH) protein